MSKPYSSPTRKVLLSMITGFHVEGDTPAWMDRKYGYVAKHSKGRDTAKQRRKKKR